MKKKPVKPTEKMIIDSVAKRKTIMRTEEVKVKSGSVAQVFEQAAKFAQKNDVDINDVKFGNSYWSGSIFKTRRLETLDEKFKRVKADMNYKYGVKLREYQRELEAEKNERARAESALAKVNAKNKVPNHTVNVQCCSCKCK